MRVCANNAIYLDNFKTTNFITLNKTLMYFSATDTYIGNRMRAFSLSSYYLFFYTFVNARRLLRVSRKNGGAVSVFRSTLSLDFFIRMQQERKRKERTTSIRIVLHSNKIIYVYSNTRV